MEMLFNVVQSIWLIVIALIGIWTIGFLVQAGVVLLIRSIKNKHGGEEGG